MAASKQVEACAVNLDLSAEHDASTAMVYCTQHRRINPFTTVKRYLLRVTWH
ncbi:MAG TPA: hypothetical protein VGU61_11480 [Noviherbaspirillum sp.]|jgi:hypothetical protein|uniref:hypothetical protein n=1 Tax=Noviherbaspirillum sp. TaxID=1926288 RepID=UPI002DDC9338|nr:hypothetical protein [Noviherbaspirillum sp.]HEV2610880.1 hypothetical protein [Noviherbaspirillum sp.]